MLSENELNSYSYGQCSIVGRSNQRAVNEDCQSSHVPSGISASSADIKGIFCIADGFGGPGFGDATSRETVNLVKEVIVSGEYVKWAKSRGIEPGDFSKVLHAVICQISSVIKSYATKQKREMGTTLDALIFRQGKFYLAHVGNSRIYLMRKGIIYRLTQDHIVDKEDVSDDSPVNLLGVTSKVRVDVFSEDVQQGDTFVLCTSGFAKTVSEDEIKYALINTETAQKAAEKLARLADKRDGSDNISVTIISTARPGREIRPPVRTVPLVPEMPPQARVSTMMKTAFVAAMGILAVVILISIIWQFIKASPAEFNAKPSDYETAIVLYVENIKKDDIYVVYRQKNKAFEAKTDETPRSPKELCKLTIEKPQFLDRADLEGGETYWYTAYRITADWKPRLDLDSRMTEGPIVIKEISTALTGTDTGSTETSGADSEKVPGRDKFMGVCERFKALEREYGGSLSSDRKDDMLKTVRDYKKSVTEIDILDQRLVPIEYRTDLVWDSKTPKALRTNLEELKARMEKTLAEEGLKPYLAGLRQKALRTNFGSDHVNYSELAQIKDNINGTSWQGYDYEFEVFMRIVSINKEIRNPFYPPAAITVTVGTGKQDFASALGPFFSEERLNNPALAEKFYEINADLKQGERFTLGTKLYVPNPEFDRGGAELIKLRDELIGEPSEYYYALKNAAKIENEELIDEYEQLVEVFRIKVLLWYAMNQNSKNLKKELLNINSSWSEDIPLYKDSYVQKTIEMALGQVQEDPSISNKENRKKITAGTNELLRLIKIFQTIDIEKDRSVFEKAVNDFWKLKEDVIIETHDDFAILKELVSEEEKTLNLILSKVGEGVGTFIGRADSLVNEVGDVSKIEGDYSSAAGKLQEAISFYRQALPLFETNKERLEVEKKIVAAYSDLNILLSSSGMDIKAIRWDREIPELSFSEVLVYLEKLSGGDDSTINAIKEKHPISYADEVAAAIRRIDELKDLSGRRIIRRLDPSGPEFDKTSFQKAITEFKFLSFALTAIVEDEKLAESLETSLADFTDRIKDGILQNHLMFEGAAKSFPQVISKAKGTAISDINNRFGGKIEQDKLDAKLIDNKGEKYVGSVTKYAKSMRIRLLKHPGGPDSYFVSVLLPPDEGDALEAARILWDDGFPIMRLSFIGGERYVTGKNYQLAIGWYDTKKEAERMSAVIERDTSLFEYISSVSVLEKSKY